MRFTSGDCSSSADGPLRMARPDSRTSPRSARQRASSRSARRRAPWPPPAARARGGGAASTRGPSPRRGSRSRRSLDSGRRRTAAQRRVAAADQVADLSAESSPKPQIDGGVSVPKAPQALGGAGQRADDDERARAAIRAPQRRDGLEPGVHRREERFGVGQARAARAGLGPRSSRYPRQPESGWGGDRARVA